MSLVDKLKKVGEKIRVPSLHDVMREEAAVRLVAEVIEKQELPVPQFYRDSTLNSIDGVSNEYQRYFAGSMVLTALAVTWAGIKYYQAKSHLDSQSIEAALIFSAGLVVALRSSFIADERLMGLAYLKNRLNQVPTYNREGRVPTYTKPQITIH